MNNYFNDAGEPLMSGEAMRYEMYLDSMDDHYDSYDRFYDNEPAEDYDECKSCGGDVDPRDNTCWDCGLRQTDESVYDGIPEDAAMESFLFGDC